MTLEKEAGAEVDRREELKRVYARLEAVEKLNAENTKIIKKLMDFISGHPPQDAPNFQKDHRPNA